MSKFLQEHKNKDLSDKRSNLVEKIKFIERNSSESLTPNKFDFIVDVGLGINDTRAALRSFHWLKKCFSIKKTPEGVFLNYYDKTHAVWALNYLREGLVNYFKTSNIFTVYEGRIIECLNTPDRKTGSIDALAEDSNGYYGMP